MINFHPKPLHRRKKWCIPLTKPIAYPIHSKHIHVPADGSGIQNYPTGNVKRSQRRGAFWESWAIPAMFFLPMCTVTNLGDHQNILITAAHFTRICLPFAPGHFIYHFVRSARDLWQRTYHNHDDNLTTWYLKGTNVFFIRLFRFTIFRGLLQLYTRLHLLMDCRKFWKTER